MISLTYVTKKGDPAIENAVYTEYNGVKPINSTEVFPATYGSGTESKVYKIKIQIFNW